LNSLANVGRKNGEGNKKIMKEELKKTNFPIKASHEVNDGMEFASMSNGFNVDQA
jgi:hypothetical protein